MLSAYNIDIAYIDGKEIAKLSQEELKKPTNEDLFECIANKDQIDDNIKIPTRMFKGPNGAEKAAVSI